MRFAILVRMVHLLKLYIPLTNFECLCQCQVNTFYLLLWYDRGCKWITEETTAKKFH